MENEELSYRYYQDFGLPFKGVPPLASRSEYVNQTSTCKIARSGMFRIGDPTYRQAGRTFEEVLTRNASGEFQIIYMREYNNGSSKDKSLPPNLFTHVIWYEQFDVLHSKQLEFIENGIKTRPQNSQQFFANSPAGCRDSETKADGVREDNQATGTERPVGESADGGGRGLVAGDVGRSEITGDEQREERSFDGPGGGDSASGLTSGVETEPRTDEPQDDTYRWDGKRRIVCTRKETQPTQEK